MDAKPPTITRERVQALIDRYWEPESDDEPRLSAEDVERIAQRVAELLKPKRRGKR